MRKYYLFFALAIVFEIFGTLMLKMSDGFSVPAYTVLFVLGYLSCFSFFTLALKKLPLGVSYGIWSGISVAAVTIIGAIIWGEPLNIVIVAGIALIIAGVLLLESSPKEQPANGDDAGRG